MNLNGFLPTTTVLWRLGMSTSQAGCVFPSTVLGSPGSVWLHQLVCRVECSRSQSSLRLLSHPVEPRMSLLAPESPQKCPRLEEWELVSGSALPPASAPHLPLSTQPVWEQSRGCGHPSGAFWGVYWPPESHFSSIWTVWQQGELRCLQKGGTFLPPVSV